MTMHSPDRVPSEFRADVGPAPVRLLLSGVEGEASALVGESVAGFPLELLIVDASAPIDPAILTGAAALVVQVNEKDAASVARFDELAKGELPLIGAAYDPSLAFVRKLVRAGAHDVVPLPLDRAELETALDPVRRMIAAQAPRGRAGHRKLVTIIKSEGGVGATCLLGQVATRFAAGEAKQGRETCLLDLDVQFGDAAFQLGLRPSLSIKELLEAGSRLDGDLIRSVAVTDQGGLKVIGAPREILPLESIGSDQLLGIVEAATAEFGTVMVDLPMNWSNWSLSLLARSDIVLMVTELRVGSLNRARRQLDLIEGQGMHNLDIRVILNRVEKGMFKSLNTADAERVLRRSIEYTVANDHETMMQAIERGVPVSEIRRKCALSRDLDTIDRGLAAALGLEH